MAFPRFVPPINPQPGAKLSRTLTLLKASFGEGYTQTSPDGMNHIRKSWDLTWPVLTYDQAMSIDNFFQDLGGYQAFVYTVPGTADDLNWTCEQWDMTVNQGGTYQITARIVRSFNLDG